MKDKEYFPVPLAHLTSPFVPHLEPPLAEEADEPEAPPREPFGMLDVVEPPESYGDDELTVLARDPFTLFVHWEVSEAGREAARARLGATGSLILRLIVTAGGPGNLTIDDPLPRELGRGYVSAPHPGALIVGVLGLRAADGRFEAITSAPPIRVPFHQAEEGAVEWAEIPPPRTRGLEIEPPEPRQRGTAEEVPGAARARVEPGEQRPAIPVALPPTSPAPTSPRGGPGGKP